MTCATVLRKLGNSPQGNNLQVKLDGGFPDAIRVKGTADAQPIRGNSGVWISGEKYATTAVTLEMLVGGSVDHECCYDANGNLVPCAAVTPTIANFTLTVQAGTMNVHVSWKSVNEVASGVIFYNIDRKLSTQTDFEYLPAGAYFDLQGDNAQYGFDDTVPAAGTYTYRIRATTPNGDFNQTPATVTV